jgi:tRNA (guanine-N7-)-methyltransferase
MLKSIRSFVRREGRMTKGQRKALETLWPKYGLEISDKAIDFQVLEIGFGMGQSLLTMAIQHPEQNFLGIEVYRPGVGALLLELEKRKLTNVRVYCADAVEVLQQCIPDNSLNKILILFPEPWPKKKHHKRRLIQIEFVKLLSKKLTAGGHLQIVTDWEDYAEHIIKIISVGNRHACSLQRIKSDPRPITKFEQRGQRLGHKIWDLCYKYS